ncbi:MAG: efflux RND transporter permease subunit [Bacteroidaceae bacterium]|nr:efflux RND transporter permease subunit [Bacteroidaceae bacterium]
MSLYEGSVKKPIMTSLVFVAIMIVGLFSFSKLPIDLVPDIESNMIMVMTYYPGAASEDIENNVTRPIENTLNSVEHLKHLTSTSSEGTSVVTLEFEFGYDIDVLTNNVRDKLDMVSSALPDACQKPYIFKFSADMIPIVMLSATASESQAALYKILDENVGNPLARIDGVGTVSIAGAPKREINVYMDPNKMEAYHVSVEAVSQAIASENMNVSAGSFDIGSNTYTLRIEGEFDSPAEMNNIIVAHAANGAAVYLRDVARIVDSLEERTQKSFTNGQQGAMIIVQKQSGANSVQIANKIHAELPKLQKQLPPDVKLGIIVDTSDNIKNTINSLTETICYAMLFVVLVVFVFLGRWRATVIIAITIPMSLIASFIYLYATGGSLNMISLSCLSIAIGNVVDDAIVVLENVTTHIERGSDPKQAAIHGTNEVAISVIASTLTMIAVFFPLTMVSGMTGVLFKQLGWMMCVIMTVSTVNALSFTPMICAQMLKLQKKPSKIFLTFYKPIQNFLDKLDAAYARMLNAAVRHRWAVLSSVIILAVVVGGLSFPFIESEYFPTNDNGRIGATIELPMGTRVEKAEEIAKRLTDSWNKKYPGMIKVINYRVGQAGSGNSFASMSSSGPHIISFNMSLVQSNERDKGLIAICDEMRDEVSKMPEIAKYEVLAGGQQGGMGGQNAAEFEIYGYDLNQTDQIAKALADSMRNNPSFVQVKISRSDYEPRYQVEFDREKLALHGLNLSTAATYVRNRIYGATATRFREDGEEYDVKVHYEPMQRISVEDIENMMIYTPTGAGVRVKDLGVVKEGFTLPTIERKDRQRMVSVTGTMADGIALSKGVKIGQQYINNMELPANVTVQVAGSYEDQMDAAKDMSTLFILIVILVFIVMAAQFESMTYPFIIILAIPFALVGILALLALTGTNLNIMSGMGAIMLAGIVVKNGIVLIDYTQLMRERGMGYIQSAVRAGRSRLRPVLMTTLTTILGMIPMAVGTGVGAEMWRPLGISVIGGLSVGTLMTLIYVPVMFCIFGSSTIRRTRKKLRTQRELNEYYLAHKDKMVRDRVNKKIED